MKTRARFRIFQNPAWVFLLSSILGLFFLKILSALKVSPIICVAFKYYRIRVFIIISKVNSLEIQLTIGNRVNFRNNDENAHNGNSTSK